MVGEYLYDLRVGKDFQKIFFQKYKPYDKNIGWIWIIKMKDFHSGKGTIDKDNRQISE